MKPNHNSLFIIHNSRKSLGFTLVELIVVIGITAAFISAAILFSRTGEKTLALARERTRLLQTLLRAKSLAVTTFVGDESSGVACGYGVHFLPPSGYALFKDTPVPPAVRCYEGVGYTGNMTLDSSEVIEQVALQGVALEAGVVTDVLFIPPDPTTRILPGAARAARIILSLESGNNSAELLVTDAGAITAR